MPSSFETLLAAKRQAGVVDRELVDAFRAATVVVPVTEASEDGQVTLPLLEWSGRRYVGAFTSQEAWTASGAQRSGYVELTGAQLAEVLPAGAGVAVNVGLKIGVRLENRAVTGQGAQRQESSVDELHLTPGTSMYYGAPATSPSAELVEAVRRAVRADDRVAAAHLFQLYKDAGGARLVVGVVAKAEADAEPAAAEMARRLGGEIPAGRWHDVMALSGPMLESIRTSTDPIS